MSLFLHTKTMLFLELYILLHVPSYKPHTHRVIISSQLQMWISTPNRLHTSFDSRQKAVLQSTIRTSIQHSGARWPSGLEHWLGMATGQTRSGSNPTSVKTFRFGTLAIPFTPLCQCLSEETLKAVYLVSMPGEVKYPTSPHWNV